MFNDTIVHGDLSPDPPQLLPFISDKLLSIYLPIIVYWVYSLVFEAISYLEWPCFEKYRLHTPLELRQRNKASPGAVFRDVVVQQLVQTICGLILMKFEPDRPSVDAVVERAQLAARLVGYNVDVKNAEVASLVLHDYVFPAARFVIAITVLDTWQYFLHRAMHLNKWLYRTFHSRHHRLYVPYAYGALYNHPIEGLLLDTIGAGLGFLVSGMSVRESVFFFTFSTLKTVDDHCGYNFPWDPLQIFFPNNSQYHDIHHQSYGIKRNFSQPYFTFWDKLLGTHMSAEEIPKRLKLTKTGVKVESEVTVTEVDSSSESSSSEKEETVTRRVTRRQAAMAAAL
ncbi:Sphingolipid C4-hydroxylase sur2 [Saitoella coloradoensis]